MIEKVTRNINIIIQFISKYKHEFNAILTLLLILVSIVLIFATSELTTATNSIKNVEIYLAEERQKMDITENMVVGENLVREMEINEIFLNSSIPLLENVKKTTEALLRDYENNRLSQARDREKFGTNEIRFQIELYFIQIDLINKDLEEIRTAQRADDTKIKNERIDSAISRAKCILNGCQPLIGINDIIKKINSYISDQRNYYNEIDKKMKSDILKLS